MKINALKLNIAKTNTLSKKLDLNSYVKDNAKSLQNQALSPKDQEKLELMEKNLRDIEQAKSQFQKVNNDTKQQKDSMKVFINCMKISRRIISGDTVPAKDHKFLKKHDPALYGKSIMMRIPKEDPKKLKAVTKKEDEKIKTAEEKMLEAAMGGSNAQQLEAHNPTSDLVASLDLGYGGGDAGASIVDVLA